MNSVSPLTTRQAVLNYYQSNATRARGARNYDESRPWVWFYETFVCGRLPFNVFAGLLNNSKLVREHDVVLMLVLPTVFLVGAYAALRGSFAGKTLSISERRAIGYMAFTIL
jgi:hypothetical protein